MKTSLLKRNTFPFACLFLLLVYVLTVVYDLTRKAKDQSTQNLKLIQAVQNSDNPVVIDALKRGADPNSRGGLFRGMAWRPSLLDVILQRDPPFTQFPVLMIAAFNGNAGNVKALVESGADVNTTMPAGSNAEGYTALIYAATYPRPDMVKILLEHGANVHFRTHDGRTALQFASSLKLTETVRLLKQAGSPTTR